ncbi:MAG: SgcJ/EcaC family oxidoreductase [Methanothrix sp.]|nr:SgcJ/EcaC family oxidoreductase [Methanothrix sp.]
MAGNASAIADFYAEDAMLLPHNNSPVIGKEAIRSGYKTFLDQFSIKGTSEIAELEVAGDWAFMRGTYTTTVIAKAGGQPVEEDHGNWLWIVKRQRDCSWKIFRAIGVSEPLVTEVRAPAVPETSKHGR